MGIYEEERKKNGLPALVLRESSGCIFETSGAMEAGLFGWYWDCLVLTSQFA